MNEVRLSDQAEQDLAEIWQHIARDNARAADDLIDRLIDRSNFLADFPSIGRLREDLREGIRSYGVGNYLVFYRVVPDGIAVIRFLHGARDLQSIFEKEPFESSNKE